MMTMKEDDDATDDDAEEQLMQQQKRERKKKLVQINSNYVVKVKRNKFKNLHNSQRYRKKYRTKDHRN